MAANSAESFDDRMYKYRLAIFNALGNATIMERASALGYDEARIGEGKGTHYSKLATAVFNHVRRTH